MEQKYLTKVKNTGCFGFLGDHNEDPATEKVWKNLERQLSKEDRGFLDQLAHFMGYTHIGAITPDSIPVLLERYDFLTSLDYLLEDERMTEEYLQKFLGYSIGYFEFLGTKDWLDNFVYVHLYLDMKALPSSCVGQKSHTFLEGMLLKSIKAIDLPQFVNYPWRTKTIAREYKKRLAKGV